MENVTGCKIKGMKTSERESKGETIMKARMPESESENDTKRENTRLSERVGVR